MFAWHCDGSTPERCHSLGDATGARSGPLAKIVWYYHTHLAVNGNLTNALTFLWGAPSHLGAEWDRAGPRFQVTKAAKAPPRSWLAGADTGRWLSRWACFFGWRVAVYGDQERHGEFRREVQHRRRI